MVSLSTSSASRSLSISSSACCVFNIKPLTFSPEQAAADHRTILSFMASTSLKSSPQTSPILASSSAASPSLICRICRSEETDARLLLSPCLCSGSLAHVHGECLLRWIDSRPAADPLSIVSELATPALSLSSSTPPSAPQTADVPSHVCELCHAAYRVRYTYTAQPVSCNRALFHLTLDSLLVALLLGLSLMLILALPPSTQRWVWWGSVLSFCGFATLSLVLVLWRFYHSNASVQLVAADEVRAKRQQRQRPQHMSMDGAVQKQSAAAETLIHLAKADEYVKLDCEQQEKSDAG